MRRALALYMAFVLAAGPGLCCCTSARLLAKATPPGEHGGQPPPAAPAPSCCHCRHEDPAPPARSPGAPPKATGLEDAPEQPTPGDHRCPCREGGPKQEFDRTAHAPPSGQSSSNYPLPSFGQVPSDSWGGSAWSLTAEYGGGDALRVPFLSARHLLYVHHLLRC